MISNHNEENLDWRLQSLAQVGSDDANEASSRKSFLQLTAVILQCVIQHIEICFFMMMCHSTDGDLEKK